ncbi:hypothetical protein UA08_07817 [Talaromyces atroroseus]|uniref:C2H2-type domain-containing protein n=1 Tax=Talaromyces atroroseus TaxID=1441469 RepID=A0A225AQR8_TALAT|nr:hypothetical protein UA08_07817 [Talaromyces atroroseus]OKL56775.1 hypothetical protein UA08_07817 [Talaromyces atroroseus]
MHEERQSIALSGNQRADERSSHAELLDLQFTGKHAEILVVTAKPKHHQFRFDVWEASADNQAPFEFNSDAWNPLKRRNSIAPNQHAHHNDIFSRPVYSPVSGYPDSGYGSQAGGDAQSLMSVPSANEFSSAFEDSGSSYATLMKDDPLRCIKCSWTGKTQSQKKSLHIHFPPILMVRLTQPFSRKHDARHAKAHRCEEDGCDAGFGTKNDLERHRKAVHSKSPRCGPTDRYKCFGRNCQHPDKVWPRLDNFKAHLDRKHADESQQALIAQSRDWYEKCKKEKSSESLAERTVDTITPSKTLNNPGTYFDIFPENSRLNEPIFDKHDPANREDIFQFTQSNRKLPGLQTVLNPVISEECMDSTTGGPEQRILPSVQAFERGVALMQALTVATLQNNGNQVPSPLNASENTSSVDNADISKDVPGMLAEKLPNISQLSNEETKFCLNVISQMHSKLTLQQASSKSGTSSPGANFENKEMARQEGLKCPNCPKWFDRQSLLKKHQKRHERPYGCTFAGCYGEFGSKADWKRHESMQHYHVQCFRCPLPREKRAECASLFSHEKEFIKHLNEAHPYVSENKVQGVIDKSRIGAYDHESKFYYWCGFCKKIKLVEKRGVEAWNERFDHIETQHFRKGENIKTWLPAKGHTMKGARKKRDKLRSANRTPKKPRKRLSEEIEQSDYYNNGEEITAYDVCSTSEDDTDVEAKQLSNNYKQKKNKMPRVDQSDKELACVICCCCHDGPHLVSESCTSCSHKFCAYCHVEKQVGNEDDYVPGAAP